MPRRSRKAFVRGTFPLTSDLLWKSFGRGTGSWTVAHGTCLRRRTEWKAGEESFGRGLCCSEAMRRKYLFNQAWENGGTFLGEVKSTAALRATHFLRTFIENRE